MKMSLKHSSIALVLALGMTCSGLALGGEKETASNKKDASVPASAAPAAPTSVKAKEGKDATPAQITEELQQMRELLMAQQAQIDVLRAELAKRTGIVAVAAASAENKENLSGVALTVDDLEKMKSDIDNLKLNQQNAALSSQDDVKRITAAELYINRFRFSGDIRTRYEDFFQTSSACGASCPPDRHRVRIRVRFGIDGKLSEDFTGGIALASGAIASGSPSFVDPVSTNETLTSFFERKTIGIDRGYITWNPQAHKWASITGGKFAFNWNRTTLDWDSDLNPEGFSEKFSKDINHSILKNVTANVLQLFYNEVGGGPDSYAAGGQVNAKLQLGSRITITPNYTYLQWHNVNPIATAVFGATRVINANAFTNATNGTGATRTFASGFAYSQVLVTAQIKTNKANLPINLTGEYHTNLRAVDSQGQASYTEISVGQTRNQRDFLLGYNFVRVERDAVISQFNESDMRAPTNVIQHRLFFSYVLRPNIQLNFTSWIGRTLNTNLQNAALAAGTVAGGKDPLLKRQQFDIVYKF